MIEILDLGCNRKVSVSKLKEVLPDIEAALFFGKALQLTAPVLIRLLQKVFRSDLIDVLFNGSHSESLQDYIGNLNIPAVQARFSEITWQPDLRDEQLLSLMWDDIFVVVADSIKELSEKLVGVMDAMPGKQGSMVFSHMRGLNVKNPASTSLYKAHVAHARHAPNAVVLDVSGSMSEETIRAIVSDVLHLAWKADAHLYIVSNKAFHWEPGQFSEDAVLAEAEFGGTHYEALESMLNRNWGVVVTIADYDSSPWAKDYLANATGSIEQLFDVSLVDRPTYLAECLGQKAKRIEPLLVGKRSLC